MSNNDLWKARLRAAIERRGMNMKSASLAAGLGATYVRDILVRGNLPAAERLQKLAEVLGTTSDFILGTDAVAAVPIAGIAGAGPDGRVLFAEGDGNLGEVPAPPGATASTAALEVRGDSMRGIANDGWLIFYDEPAEPSREMIGEPCVLWLEDGRVLIKTPYPTKRAGLFDLESANAPLMRDIPVRKAALVTFIAPRASARKVMRRLPEMTVTDVEVEPTNKKMGKTPLR